MSSPNNWHYDGSNVDTAEVKWSSRSPGTHRLQGAHRLHDREKDGRGSNNSHNSGFGIGDSVEGDDDDGTAFCHKTSDAPLSSINTSVTTTAAALRSSDSIRVSMIGGRGNDSSLAPSSIAGGRMSTSGWMSEVSISRSSHYRTPASQTISFSNIPLRKYQRQIATSAVTVAHEKGCVVNLPTGSGKTNIAAAISLHELISGAEHGIRAAVMIVPTRDLVTQQADVFHRLIADNPAVAPLLDAVGIKEIVVMYRLGGKSLQRMGGSAPNETPQKPNRSHSATGKQTSVIFVATAEVYNTHVQRSPPHTGFDILSDVPPLSVTSTVFFDEVHHCGKKHPYATTARTIFEGGGISHIPRVIGLSATLSYASVGFEQETSNLLQMMRCGSGRFQNADEGEEGDSYAEMERSFIFSRTLSQLVKQGYNHPGQVKALSEVSSITICHADNYMLVDLQAHDLWTDMLHKLQDETKGKTFDEVLRLSPAAGKIHPLVLAAFLLTGKLEPMVFASVPLAGITLGNKSTQGELAYKNALGAFEQCLVDNHLLGEDWELSVRRLSPTIKTELKNRACQLRIVALYLHCVLLVRMVTVTRQQELETALRGFLLYWATTTPASTQPIFDSLFMGSSLPEVDVDIAKLLQKIKLELDDNQALGKFDELKQAVEERLSKTPSLRAIVFAENVAMCAIIAKNLSAKGISAEWYTSKNNAPYFNVARRSLTDQRAVLDAFRNGETSILVGTTVLEEGIDVPEVKLTVHYTPPTNIVSMVQRQGRARESESESLLVDHNKLDTLTHNQAQYHKQQQHLQTHNPQTPITADPHDTYVPFAPPVDGSSSSALKFETKQAFSANLQNFKDWLSGRDAEPSEQRPSSQILNEMAQRLTAKCLGKITQSVHSLQGISQQQHFTAKVSIELRMDSNSVDPFIIMAEESGLGKKKALCSAASDAILKIKQALNC